MTLGDAWGIQKFAPEMFDNRGTSVVFVHTAKGNDFFERATLIKRQVSFFDATLYNPAFIVPLAADTRRKNFFANIEKIPDKFAVMQHFAAQDNSAIHKQVGEKNRHALMQSYQEIAAQVRQKFKQSVLVLTSMHDERGLKILGNQFEQNFPNVGVYLLRPVDNGRLACTENFSSLTFALKDAPADLTNFARQLKIAAVFVDQATRFYSPVVVDWLKGCGLPIQTFALPKK